MEILDYVGDQLLRANDREGAVYAALLIRHLLERDPEFFKDHKLVGHSGMMQLENNLGMAINQTLFPDQQGVWLLSGLDLIKSGFRATEAFAKVISRGKSTPPGQRNEAAG